MKTQKGGAKGNSREVAGSLVVGGITSEKPAQPPSKFPLCEEYKLLPIGWSNFHPDTEWNISAENVELALSKAKQDGKKAGICVVGIPSPIGAWVSVKDYKKKIERIAQLEKELKTSSDMLEKISKQRWEQKIIRENEEYERGKQQGKLEQSFLSADKNLGKNEMTAKELVELLRREEEIHITRKKDTYGSDFNEHYTKAVAFHVVGEWLKSQLKKEEVD